MKNKPLEQELGVSFYHKILKDTLQILKSTAFGKTFGAFHEGLYGQMRGQVYIVTRNQTIEEVRNED